MTKQSGRWLLFFLGLQLLTGGTMLFVTAWNGRAPGPLTGAVLTSLVWLALKQERISARPAVVLVFAGVIMGLVYPWPWTRVSHSDVERLANVRKLAGPDGCVCIALAVPPLMDADETTAQAKAFCLPQSDGRFTPWLDAGTVATQWRLTLQRTGLDEPALMHTQLLHVGGAQAAILESNNGCRL